MKDAESVRNMYSNLAVTNKQYCQSCILLVLYIIQMPDFENKSIIAHHAHTVRTNRYTKQIGFGAWIICNNVSLRLTTLALINSSSLLTAKNWTLS